MCVCVLKRERERERERERDIDEIGDAPVRRSSGIFVILNSLAYCIICLALHLKTSVARELFHHVFKE